MAIRKSTRTKPGRGGRPTGTGPRHTDPKSRPEVVTDFNELPSLPKDTDEGDVIKKTIRTALEKNMKHLSSWLEEVGELDPKAALTLFMGLSEFVTSKVSRVDSVIDRPPPVKVKYESTAEYQDRMKAKEAKQSKTPSNDFP